MKCIFKYRLPIRDRVDIPMPSGAKILSCQAQGDDRDLFIWALVDTEAPLSVRHFRIFGTGHPADDAGSMIFIGTAMMLDGRLVWHVFEE